MNPFHSPEDPSSRGRWKHGAIPVIGLIGGIGGGKSCVASRLRDFGAAVIDADAVGHDLLGDPEIRAQIVAQFGEGVLEKSPADGDTIPRIDRRSLGKVVFADPAARRTLEAIVHPPMRRRFLEEIGDAAHGGEAGFVVLDAAILLEAGWEDLCDRIVFVDAPRSERLRRVAAARGWSEETLESRERSQWPNEAKRRRADWILTNESGPESLGPEIDRLIARLREAAGPAEASLIRRRRHDASPLTGSSPDNLMLSEPAPAGRMS